MHLQRRMSVAPTATTAASLDLIMESIVSWFPPATMSDEILHANRASVHDRSRSRLSRPRGCPEQGRVRSTVSWPRGLRSRHSVFPKIRTRGRLANLLFRQSLCFCWLLFPEKPDRRRAELHATRSRYSTFTAVCPKPESETVTGR
jgi:hypothetical protein